MYSVQNNNLDTVQEKTVDDTEESDILTVQQVAEIAAAAHGLGGTDDSTDSSAAAPPDRAMRLPKRNSSFRRSDQITPMPVLPERSQSMQISRPARTPSSRNEDGPLSRMSGIRQPPQRTGSSRAGGMRRLPGRTRSTDSGLRRVPGRTVSSDSGQLRGFRRDGLVNTSVGRDIAPGMMRGVQRTKSGGGGLRSGVQRQSSSSSILSVDTTSGVDSCWTMDSVNLRKTQLIADPLDAGTYHSCDDSYANHDDSMSTYSMNPHNMVEYVEYRPEYGPSGNDGASVSTMDDLRLQDMTLNPIEPSGCDVSFFSQSFGTLESGDLSDSDFDDDGEIKQVD